VKNERLLIDPRKVFEGQYSRQVWWAGCKFEPDKIVFCFCKQHQNWPAIWNDINKRKQIAEESEKWSERVLKMSGLLE